MLLCTPRSSFAVMQEEQECEAKHEVKALVDRFAHIYLFMYFPPTANSGRRPPWEPNESVITKFGDRSPYVVQVRQPKSGIQVRGNTGASTWINKIFEKENFFT